MPLIGLGTGGYAPNNSFPHGEYWNDSVAEIAVSAWLKLGGRRIDAAFSYHDQVGVGKAIRESGIPREQIFITSKVGPGGVCGGALGYNDTLDQMKDVLSSLNVTYVDLLLIHWPYVDVRWPYSRNHPSTDSLCQGHTPQACRQSTWKAMQLLFRQNKTRAIGISNFEAKHIQDILDMGEMIPSVNQCEFHPYFHELDLVEFCKKHKIVFNGYASIGTPDWGPWSRNWNSSISDLPLVKSIAEAHKKSPVQVLLRYSLQHEIALPFENFLPGAVDLKKRRIAGHVAYSKQILRTSTCFSHVLWLRFRF
ncbi:aldo-keto reductase Mvan_2161-like [Oscarella lobularis]|uniref:aldo-keto reductase Mvan_2161-like n=1 Tax=Oscarella lobularis TaxID=121494 RepID=UPI003313AAC3